MVSILHNRNGKCLFVTIAAFLVVCCAWCKPHSEVDSVSQNRKYVLYGGGLAGVSSSYVLLDQLWYKKYDRTKFHFFNDNNEWLQMDKVGHLFSTYTIGRYSYEAFRWSGMNEKKSTWIGGSAGLLYLTGVELMDSKSAAWGFSNGDMIANTAGTFFFIAQQLFWKEQRIVFKFSYSHSEFAMLNSDQLGRNFQQRVLKDYNGQTYWSSINIHSFMASDADFPRWLNVAFGYGATKMIRAEMNDFDVNNFRREREFYISFDADLTRVHWKKKWMKTTAKVLSFIKIPTPTLEFEKNGKVKMHGLFF
jgi:uncharacterized protein YfiM (DUF2279 family)